jgi:hypothetical protein
MAAGAPVSDPFRLLSPWHLHRYSTFLCVIATGPILQACFPTCDKVMPESEGTANVSACVSKFSSRRKSIRWANPLYSACAVNQPAGRRMPGTHTGPEVGGGKSDPCGAARSVNVASAQGATRGQAHSNPPSSM